MFVLGGLITGYIFNAMMASTDIFIELFDGRSFGFYQVLPSYTNIPFSIMLTRLLNKIGLSMKAKITICLLSITITFVMVPVLSLMLENTLTSNDFSAILIA